MNHFQIYKDIQARTNGEIYIGVVGPVRSGKSTFIRRFMELVALPALSQLRQSQVRDELPLSGSGKLITTVEPKFIPKEAVNMVLGEDIKVSLRLIDCVGFLIPDAVGNMEEGKERMVKTPWFEHEIPFHQAAEVGTRKVIEEHATIGLVMTCDGSFGEIPRENFRKAEEKTIRELENRGKPFLVIVNSQKPYGETAAAVVKEIEENYHVSALAVNCEQLRREDVGQILEKVLYEFPLGQIQFFIPKWVEILSLQNPLKVNLLEQIRQMTAGWKSIRDLSQAALEFEGPYVERVTLEQLDLATGIVRVQLHIREQYYYEMLSEMTGISMGSEYELIHMIREFARMKEEYVKVQSALEAVRGCGYGVVTPEREDIELEEPEVIKQGNKYGVKIKSQSPSIHMIKANIETEIAPIVGTKEQAEDLIAYIKEGEQRGETIWETNIFGKSIERLVEDGIRSKIAVIGEESQGKLQESMQKIVNDSKGGLVCFII